MNMHKYYIVNDSDGEIDRLNSEEAVDNLLAEFRHAKLNVEVYGILETDSTYEIYFGSWEYSNPGWRGVPDFEYKSIYEI